MISTELLKDDCRGQVAICTGMPLVGTYAARREYYMKISVSSWEIVVSTSQDVFSANM